MAVFEGGVVGGGEVEAFCGRVDIGQVLYGEVFGGGVGGLLGFDGDLCFVVQAGEDDAAFVDFEFGVIVGRE